jgi:hypothetical protein
MRPPLRRSSFAIWTDISQKDATNPANLHAAVVQSNQIL